MKRGVPEKPKEKKVLNRQNSLETLIRGAQQEGEKSDHQTQKHNPKRSQGWRLYHTAWIHVPTLLYSNWRASVSTCIMIKVAPGLSLPTTYSKLPCRWSSCLVLSVGAVTGNWERPLVPVSGGTHRHSGRGQKMAPASSVAVSKPQNLRYEAGHSVLVWPSFFCSFRSPMQCAHTHKHTLNLFADPALTSHHFLPQFLPNALQPILCIKSLSAQNAQCFFHEQTGHH